MATKHVRSLSLPAYQRLMQLRLFAEVKAAWNAACKAEGIPVDSKFVVFGNTPEARAYNTLAGKLLDALEGD